MCGRSQASWFMPVIPATKEAEVEENHGSRSMLGKSMKPHLKNKLKPKELEARLK
jgi:hypothetical protein